VVRKFFGRPQFWHFAKQHTYFHFDIYTDFGANTNIDGDAKGVRTAHEFGEDDEATHKRDESI
jgi:hypothetical protein